MERFRYVRNPTHVLVFCVMGRFASLITTTHMSLFLMMESFV